MSTIAEKIEYLDNTRELLKDNINKINNVLDDESTFRSYPEKLFNGYIDILNNGTETLWNNLEKASQNGTEAVLEGVETAPMKIELQGNTSQRLLPKEYQEIEYIKFVNGASFSYIDTEYVGNLETEAIVELSATGVSRPFGNNASSSRAISIYLSSSENAFQRFGNKAVKYSYTYGTKIKVKTNKTGYYIDDSLIENFNTTNVFTTFGNLYIGVYNTPSNGNNPTIIYSCKIYDNGNLVRNFIPCYRKTDNQVGMYDIVNNLFYEPQGEGVTEKGNDITIAPTPDTPQEVQVVTGENVVSVSGKNLAPIKDGTVTLNGLTINVENGIITINGTSTASVSLKLTNDLAIQSGNINPNWVNEKVVDNINGKVLSFQNISGTAPSSLWAIRLYSNNASAYTYQYTYSNLTGDKKFTIDSYLSFISIFINANLTFNDFKVAIQLEEGSTATQFVQYVGQEYTISLGTLELCKIGNYQDYLYKKNGKWYKHSEIDKMLIDENSTISGFNTHSGTTYITANFYDTKIKKLSKFEIVNFSNKLVGGIGNDTWQGNKLNSVSQQSNGNYIQICLPYSVATTIAELKMWLTSNNILIYYVLETPTEEEITDETLIKQLETLYKAKSVKNKTYITQENEKLPFILDVSAIKEYSVT